jgi:hypothetical protein
MVPSSLKGCLGWARRAPWAVPVGRVLVYRIKAPLLEGKNSWARRGCPTVIFIFYFIFSRFKFYLN